MNVLKVDRYRVLEHLGRGASADVYLAEDSVLRRKVALKLLRFRDPEPRQLQRFEREAQCASMLNHPNVVTVFDIGVDNGVHFIASEYIEGETLRHRLTRGPLPFAEAVDITLGVTSALAAAHEAWIVHRDVKPENIMLRRDRGVKVLDFGVATLAGGGDYTDPLHRPGALAGTLHYLSPEQVRGEPIIDTRSDVYSIGVVLYEMLAGYPPFIGETPLDVLAAIVEGDAPPLPDAVPLALHKIVEKAMRKSIWERWQTASELSERLIELRLDLMMRERGPRSAD